MRRFGDSGRASTGPPASGEHPGLVPACLSFRWDQDWGAQRCDVMTTVEERVAYSEPELVLLLVPAQTEVGVFISDIGLE